MDTHFLNNIQNKRANFKKYAQKAVENNWITQQEYNEFIAKIENSKLVIGVIGQMKAGKSTFLNALIFNDEVLPAATTPMTASLSTLTYGPEKKLEAEFYTKQEWEELKIYASKQEAEYEGNTNEQSKIKAAKEIVSKGIKIEKEISSLLGTKKQDKFEHLIEYVGADGKYIAITKSVKIEYPLEYLKGVEIVDTPGFNDPVVSREQRTKDFLQHADVVIMLLYAGRAFDATDNDIIFNKVRSIGIGKLLIGVNKYDINYSQGETEEQMISYVKEQLLKASNQHSSNSIVELVKERDPLLLSANMALMAKMDLSKIQKDENLKFYYTKALADFEISSQNEMLEKSLMPKFEGAIQTNILNAKEDILINKPLNLIKQKGENKLLEFKKNKEQFKNYLTLLNKPDIELDQIIESTTKIKNRFDKKIKILETEIKDEVIKNKKKIKREIIFMLNDSIKNTSDFIDRDWSFNPLYQKENINRVNQFEVNFILELKNFFSDQNDQLKRKLKNKIDGFINEVKELMDKILSDFHYDDYIRLLKEYFLEDFLILKYNDLTKYTDSYTEFQFSDIFALREYMKTGINKFYSNFNLASIDEQIDKSVAILLENIKQDLFNEFLTPITEKAQELKSNKQNREIQLKELTSKSETIKQDISNLEKEIETMKVLENI